MTTMDAEVAPASTLWDDLAAGSGTHGSLKPSHVLLLDAGDDSGCRLAAKLSNTQGISRGQCVSGYKGPGTLSLQDGRSRSSLQPAAALPVESRVFRLFTADKSSGGESVDGSDGGSGAQKATFSVFGAPRANSGGENEKNKGDPADIESPVVTATSVRLSGNSGFNALLSGGLGASKRSSTAVVVAVDLSAPQGIPAALECVAKAVVVARDSALAETTEDPIISGARWLKDVRHHYARFPSPPRVYGCDHDALDAESQVNGEEMREVPHNVLTKNLGVPLLVVGTNSEALMAGDSFSDSQVEVLQGYLRSWCLQHGATLCYTGSPGYGFKTLHNILRFLCSREGVLPEPQFVAPAETFIPFGWDSEGKIAHLLPAGSPREAFFTAFPGTVDPDLVSEGGAESAADSGAVDGGVKGAKTDSDFLRGLEQIPAPTGAGAASTDMAALRASAGSTSSTASPASPAHGGTTRSASMSSRTHTKASLSAASSKSKVDAVFKHLKGGAASSRRATVHSTGNPGPAPVAKNKNPRDVLERLRAKRAAKMAAPADNPTS